VSLHTLASGLLLALCTSVGASAQDKPHKCPLGDLRKRGVPPSSTATDPRTPPVPPVPLSVTQDATASGAPLAPPALDLFPASDSLNLEFGGHLRAVSVSSAMSQPRISDNTAFAEVRLAHLHVQGALTDRSIGFRLEQDFARNELADAYLQFPLGGASLRVGQFRAPFTASSMRHEGDLFFLERSRIGALFGGHEAGLEATGSTHGLDWALALQDGADGSGQDLLTIGRLTYRFPGRHAAQATAADRALVSSGSLSAAAFRDSSDPDATGVALDLAATGEAFSLGVEVFFLGDSVYTGNGFATEWLGYSRRAKLSPNTVPWTVQCTFLVAPDWEAGVRLQDSNNDARESRMDMAVGRGVRIGPVRWTGQYSRLRSDKRGDTGIVQIGVSFGF